MVIVSTLELPPTHIVTSSLTRFCSFYNSRFELLILATEPVSNTQGLLRTLVKYTSVYQIYLCSLCHPSYPPNIWGSSASSDHSLCSTLLQDAANATLRLETLQRNCVR